MIFITVGTQFPFDRLVKVVDEWLDGKGLHCVGQVCDGMRFKPKNIITHSFLSSEEFQKKFSNADLIISHAGMGNVINSILSGKRIIVFPRLAELGEHRNNHQLDTCKFLEDIDGCDVVYTEHGLVDCLNSMDFTTPMDARELNLCELTSYLNNIIGG